MSNFLKDIPGKTLVPGIVGHYVHGERMTFGLIEIEAGSDLPAHQHPHEQITYILEGELDMMIGGERHELKAGMHHVIPSNTLHSAKAKKRCVVIDAFGPVREDYR